MRVALDTSAVGPGMTGIGAYALTLALTLPRYDRGRQYVLVSPDGTGCGATDAQGRALPVIGDSGGAMWHQLGMPSELESWEVGIYHSPLFTSPLVKVCQYVVTMHDVIPLAAPEHCQPEFLRFFEQWAAPCLELADRVVTVSEYSRQDIMKHLSLSEDKLTVVPECVRPVFRPAAPGESLAGTLSKYRIRAPFALFVGTIEPRKNVDGIIAAYARLSARTRENLSLVIVGRQQSDGLDVSGLADRLDVRDTVSLPGYVADEDLVVLYRAARMFVFPSRYEGFGLPVLEAMASGVPVITSTVTSLPEVAGDAALLVDPDDVDGLADAMQQLDEDDDLRRRLTERGLARASHFSPDEMVRQMTAVYDSLEGAN